MIRPALCPARPVEVSGPAGIASIAVVQDTPRTPQRITVTLRNGRKVLPVAVFLDAPGRQDVRIGMAEVRRGTWQDAILWAEALVATEGAGND